jgi:hypothetical protein
MSCLLTRLSRQRLQLCVFRATVQGFRTEKRSRKLPLDEARE